jgi:hypothetical protein
MQSEKTSLKPTPGSLAQLWREIAVYLEIWDVIRSDGITARAAA